MLERILEPEVMDTAQEAHDYDTMDHSAVNQRFVADLRQVGFAGRILDVGTGTALIPIELLRQCPDARVVAIDLAAEMLTLGQRNLEQAGLAHAITLERVNAREMPYADASFGAVISNSIIHHIPQPELVLREIARVVQPGGRIFVRDLMRPHDAVTLQHLVDLHAAGATDNQRRLFAESLHAALTLDEVRSMVAELGYAPDTVHATSDRHWTWSATRPMEQE
ncbi:class I SAM-dependent methyltransferase [Tuwongella immobilis]|uniref:Methyltransferase type 11 domain-containing protein n=1 Tax=Tuwongella immobilis TaxID=692036 RepID=A0A6C2YIX1_9BACT|nr:class I SAM-dependent methyltransferase [Tuwongella immobilis]VIP01498.1 coq5 methyltransferase : UbiE/COQ5 methyltransferase OS=Sorangium cellulosum (strain So ce56) GN=sce7963 PE=4 SV=1: Methyltransf_11 [Tuwongella immobilis]VTR98586.1 coq5 methyltransferase : UbiE/COQ5 methyltransferase OS=Sorangium cellulosum (strain So ce56) GN=sce7963 PE=4 SV=1: Methyltransf_11 [Tuwongella immobilis]